MFSGVDGTMFCGHNDRVVDGGGPLESDLLPPVDVTVCDDS